MTQSNIHGSRWSELISNKDDDLTMLVATLFVLFTAVSLWFRSTRLSSPNGAPSLPPGPISLPIVGYLPFLRRDLHKQFTTMAQTYGPIFKVQLGSKLHVVINSLDLVKAVLRDQDEIFANRNPPAISSVVTYGGNDLVWSNNNSNWRILRKLFVYEAMSNKNLEASSPYRRGEVRKTIKNVYDRIGTPIDLDGISFATESNVITSMIWETTSVKGAEDRDLAAELRVVASKVIQLFGKPNVSDFVPWLERFDLQGIQRETTRHIRQLDQILSSIIDDRIKSNSEKPQDATGHEGKKDFLQILLELMDQKDATSLDITQVKALLVDIIIAGTDTTATLTEWTMTEIMRNDNVMKKVQEELTEVVGLDNIVEESHLPKLRYLEATIKETFRLHPILPFLIPRSPIQDCTVGGYTIPKGCVIFVNVWAIHRDPRYWDNPLEFNPERFLNDEGTQKCDLIGNNLKFLPFGSGRRSCPGLPLAEKMPKYILASLLHSFDWKLSVGEEHDLSDKFGITLTKRKPLVAIPSQRLPSMDLYM